MLPPIPAIGLPGLKHKQKKGHGCPFRSALLENTAAEHKPIFPVLAFNAIDSYPAGFHGIRMQNLAIPQVNAVMRDSLCGFVDSGIIGTFASFIRHKEHDVSWFQVSPIRCCFSNFFYIFGLCPGIAGKNDAGPVFKRLSNKVRAVESPGIGAAGTKFVRRSQIFYTGFNHVFGCAGSSLCGFTGRGASH